MEPPNNPEQLLQYFADILAESNRRIFREEIKAALVEMKRDTPPDRMTAKEAAAFLGIALPTLYSKVSKNQMEGTYSKKFKSLVFSRKKLSELI